MEEIGGRIAASIAKQGYGVDCDWSADLPAAKLSRELDHYLNLRDGSSHPPHVWLWSNAQCLVATRRHARNEKFAAAAEKMRDMGWPVAVRQSGGSVVPHGPAILNLSLFHDCDEAKIEQGYRPLIALLLRALEDLDIQADYGSCAGSFCDGAYNLLINGQKLAGTAAMLKRGAGRYYWLSHATIMIDTDIQQAVDAVSTFERLIGIEQLYQTEKHVNLIDHFAASRGAQDSNITMEAMPA